MKLPAKHYQFLENAYLRHFPIDIPNECLSDYNSILQYQYLIKRTIPDARVLNKLIDILIGKIKNKQRFQKLTMLKLIKHHLQQGRLEKDIIDKLFFIFQSLIIDAKDKLAWKLTTTIKDVELSNEQLGWLIDNYDKSEHIINRLLRYPKPNKKIYEWGKRCLRGGELENRLSELIGIHLNFNKNFKHKAKVAYVWGIHYSKLKEETKKDLLLRATTTSTILEIIKICERNNYMDIIAFYYNKCS